MAARSNPTFRQRRLGAELRKLRERTGMTVTQAGALLGIDQARMSSIELGRAAIGAARLRTLACAYDCADQALIEALVGMTGGGGRRWWHEYRGVLPAAFLDLAELEHHAVAMRTVHTVHMPGLLQTREYARTIFEQNDPPLPPFEVEHRLSHRMKRQAVLFRDDPPKYTAVIHEAALRMQFGGREVARGQLRHLVEMSQRPNIRLMVIPFSSPVVPGAGQAVFYAEGPVRDLDTVQLDTEHGAVFLDAEAVLHKYRVFIDRMENAALDGEEARSLAMSVFSSLS